MKNPATISAKNGNTQANILNPENGGEISTVGPYFSKNIS
jgi:hypothetical protein